MGAPNGKKTTPPLMRSASGSVVARAASPGEVRAWDDLVTQFSNHRITHTVGWMRYLEASVGGRATFIVFEKAGAIVGCLPGLLVRLGPLRLFGSPLPGWQTSSMGPAFAAGRITTAEITTSALTLLQHSFGVHHVELVSADLDAATMQDVGFRGESVPTFRAPLHPQRHDTALKQLKTNARRNVQRGIRLGLLTKFEDDESFVDEAYSQITEVFIRGGNTVPFGKHRVLEFFRHMKASGRLLAISVYLPDRPVSIASGMFTVCGNELALWQWAHRTAYRWYRPTELMTWVVMQKAMEAGCTTFDLMGLGDFKANFGAHLDESLRRWVWSGSRYLVLLRDFAEICYRHRQSIMGRLAQHKMRLLGGRANVADVAAGRLEENA